MNGGVVDKEISDSILEQSRKKFEKIAQDYNLLDEDISVLVKILSPEEAIGNPGRRDFPIVTGKERVIEADFCGASAHAFTDSPKEFIGKLQDVIDLPLSGNGERAILIGTMNAVLKHLNIIETTLHCKDEEPEKCAKEITSHIKQTLRTKKVGLIGLNPAIAEALTSEFGAENIRINDLNPKNIGTVKYGVEIRDGSNMTEQLVQESNVVLVTGTTLVNDTFDAIWKAIRQYGKDYFIYGVTSSGICKMIGLNRICPYGRK
jgi:uncharacterized protein (DUF4213/DUF364 family)